MRLLLGLLLTTAVATSQTLSTPMGPSVPVGLGGAIYFDLDCLAAGGLTVTSLALNLGPNVAGTVDVYLRTGSASPLVANGWQPFSMANPVVAAGAGTFTQVPLNRTIPLGRNCVIGVAVVTSGTLQHFVRLPGGWGTTATIPGVLEMTFGLQSAAPFAAPVLGDAVVQVIFVPGGQCPEPATVTSFGAGCLPGAPLLLAPWAPFDRPVQETPAGLTRPFWAITTGIPATAFMHLGIVGLTDIPGGIPLASIGLDPRCRLYCQADLISPDFFPFGAPPSWPWLVTNIPPIGPSYWGLEFCVQSAALTTAFGAADLTSNGLRCKVGAW